MPFGVNLMGSPVLLMRSPVLYRAAQVVDLNRDAQDRLLWGNKTCPA